MRICICSGISGWGRRMTEAAITRRDGAVLHVINNNPEARNALSPEFYDGFRAALALAADDPAVAVVVLSGADGFFCAGGNLNVLKTRAAMPVPERLAAINGLHDVIRAIRACPRPVIAAVEGGAAGAGASLALACDLIVVAEDAYFALSYLRIGLTPDGGATAFLSDAVPRQLVAEFLMFGDKVPVQRLCDLGAINRVVGKARTVTVAQGLGERLASLPPDALASVKRLIGQAEGNDLAAQLEAEAQAMAQAQGGAEAAEGISAFLDKRKPDFSQFRK
jgi:enoyl-CoA hydratase/carnithine racemase